jgi:hypothetical protein
VGVKIKEVEKQRGMEKEVKGKDVKKQRKNKSNR